MSAETTSPAGFGTVLFAVRDGVAWVTLNRPEHLNAYNVAMRDDLYAILTAIHDDPSKCVRWYSPGPDAPSRPAAT